MSIETAQSASLRAAIAANRDALETMLERYKAANPRVFGSVARGDATSGSDIDLLVDLMPGGGNRRTTSVYACTELGASQACRIPAMGRHSRMMTENIARLRRQQLIGCSDPRAAAACVFERAQSGKVVRPQRTRSAAPDVQKPFPRRRLLAST